MARPNLKEKILHAGLERLTAKGFGATSVGDIAEAAGAPKGSFYNHFRSKEHLAVEALDLYLMQQEVERLHDATYRPVERLRRYFEFMAEQMETKEFRHGCLMGGLAAFLDAELPLVQQAVGAAYTDVTSAVAAVLGEAKGAGELPPGSDAGQLATVILDAWEGAVLRMRVEGRRRPFDAFFVVVFDLLIPGLCR